MNAKTPPPPSSPDSFTFSSHPASLNPLSEGPSDFFTKNKLPILLVGVVLILTLVSGGAYLSLSRKMPKPVQTLPAVVIPTPTLVVSQTGQISASPSATPSLVPTTSPYFGWKSYTFGPLALTFQYPPTWNIAVSSTSDGRSLHAGDAQVSTIGKIFSPATDTGLYSIYIGSYSTGITTMAQLQAALAKDYGASTFYYGTSAGTMTITNAQTTTINGYQVYERTLNYSLLPTVTTPQAFVMDSAGNVIKTELELDTIGGLSLYKQVLNSFHLRGKISSKN